MRFDAEAQHWVVFRLTAKMQHWLGCVQFDAEKQHQALAGFRPMHDILFISFPCIGLAFTAEMQQGTSPRSVVLSFCPCGAFLSFFLSFHEFLFVSFPMHIYIYIYIYVCWYIVIVFLFT